MKESRQRRRPTFFWQGGFILLPVLVLAILGLLSLRQDRLLAEQEARQHAEQIADDLARKIRDALATVSASPQTTRGIDVVAAEPLDTNCVFQIDEFGRLISPPDYAVVPVPQAPDETQLDAGQRRLWQTARTAEFRAHDRAAAIQVYRRFLASNPPADFAGAQLEFGLLLLKQGQVAGAARVLAAVITNAPDARLESGLPIAPVAELKLIEAARSRIYGTIETHPLEAWCSNAVVHPTLFTPRLLADVAAWQRQANRKNTAAQWEKIWRIQERTRAVYHAVRQKWFAGLDATTPVPTDTRGRPALPAAWIDLDEPWLVQPLGSQKAERAFIGRTESTVRRIMNETVRAENLPAYLDAGVTLSGRRLREALRVAGVLVARPSPIGSKNLWVRPDAAYVASSDGRMLRPVDRFAFIASNQGAPGDGSGREDIQVAVYLTDPIALFTRQRQRTVWFALLIGAAATAAVIGYVAAWRAFYRQQRLSDMKTNFVSSVSHELRAPIASVRLMAEGLERGKVQPPERQREYFQFIVQECRRLSSLIENVLDFSRIEQGRKQYDLEPTDLTALVRQSVKLMEPCAAERQVQLAVTVPTEPVAADVDGKAIQQALVNLIDNAIKHSPAGGTVTVGLSFPKSTTPSDRARNVVQGPKSETDGRRAEETPQFEITNLKSETARPKSELHQSRLTAAAMPAAWPPSVCLFVSDDGEGIPPAEHERIFERFYRRGSELRRTTPGVGIGLSLVKHIVEAHGGRVRVQSAVGQGSRFTIELPLTQSKVQHPKPKAV